MSAENPLINPEKKPPIDDNARKFLVDTFNPTEVADSRKVSSHILVVDWLETDEQSETKLAHKTYGNGHVQILLIKKVTVDGDRKAVKEEISEEKYKELLELAVLHLEKRRYEFDVTQGENTVSMKYDEFVGSDMRILEVDSDNEAIRDAFDPETFPVALQEVTGQEKYYGYKVAELLSATEAE